MRNAADSDKVTRLYKHLNGLVRQLDEYRSNAKNFEDLFSIKLYNQRLKLRSFCEKVIFHDTVGFGVKTEELLWQKIFYDIIATSKKLKSHLTTKEHFLLNSHIDSAIGFYHHLLMKFFYIFEQYGNCINMSRSRKWDTNRNYGVGDESVNVDTDADNICVLDFIISCNRLEFQDGDSILGASFVDIQDGYVQKIRYLVYRCLLILGDLNRYKNEFFPESNAREVAINFYTKANDYGGNYGMPCNQIASLVSNSYHSLDSVFFYLKSLNCERVFQGTESNLMDLYEKKRTELISLRNANNNSEFIGNYMTKFLVWILKIYFNRDRETTNGHDGGNHIDVDPDIIEVVNDFETCLDFVRDPATNFNRSKPDYLNDEMLLKVISISMFVTQKLTKKPDPNIDEFLFRVLDRLMKRLQNGTLRNGHDNHNYESDESETSDDNNDKPTDYLNVIKLLLDWSLVQIDFWKEIDVRQFSNDFVDFLNGLLKTIKSDVIDQVNDIDRIPLSEDFLVKNMTFLRTSHKYLLWDYYSDGVFSEDFDRKIRRLKLVEIGKRFASGMFADFLQFDDHSGQFLVVNQAKENKVTVKTTSNQQLMQNMGQLWLEAEIKELENLVHKTNYFSPFLILDSNALVNQFSIVKYLVSTRKFVIIIPNTVFTVLDEMKLDSTKVRDIIRWLESTLCQGNRFIRGQRPHEKLTLPLLKYPRRKHNKHSWHLIGIVECCHYFMKQKDTNQSMVTLLYDNGGGSVNRQQPLQGSNSKNEISLISLSRTIEVKTELITMFYDSLKNFKLRRK